MLQEEEVLEREAETEIEADGDDSAGAQFEFDDAFQNKITALFMRDTQFARRCKDLIDPSYFTDQANGALIAMIKSHLEVHKSVPDLRILPQLVKDARDAKKLRDDLLPDVKVMIRNALKADLSNSSYVQDKVREFARNQAMEQAILESALLHQKGDYKKIAEIMKRALAVGTQTDDGDYDYFEEISNRTKVREDFLAGKIIKSGISTGYSEIDAYLYHNGWGRKEMSLIMGAAKAGKSLSLGEFTKNASLMGYNTAYLSLEVSKEIISDRLDANISDTAMRLLKDNPKAVEAKIRAAQAKAGALRIRDYPPGYLKPSAIQRIIENYRAEGMVLDLLSVDYADIMAPEYRSDNQIENFRAIYIDLRALAVEHNLALLTATQTNRSGAAAHTSKMTDVAEDFNKIRTADIVLGINATEDERRDGEARLTWVASRNTEDGFSIRIKQDRERLKFLTKVLGRV